MICQQCRRECSARKRKRFCSYACHHLSMRLVSRETILPLIESGMGKSQMSRVLGVERTTIRKAVEDYGLQSLWRQRRYA